MKKFFAIIALALLLSITGSACALTVTPVGAKNIVTCFNVTDTYTLLYAGGIRYDSESPRDEMLVNYDDEFYVVNLINRRDGKFQHEEWRISEELLLPPVIEEGCENPILEKVLVHRYWRNMDDNTDAGETYETMFRLILPPHNIILSK